MRIAPWLSAVALVAVAASTTVDPVSAHQAHRGHVRLQEALGLTDQQVQAMREVRTRDAEAGKQLFRQLRQTRLELTRLVLADADTASIEAKQAEVQALMNQVIERRVTRLKEIVPILTPEQREKYAELVTQGGFGHRHGHRRPSS
jgi:Spy/CpxP family protein refolding chaperone